MNGEHPNTREALSTDPVSHTPGPWSVEKPLEFELSIVEADKPTHEWKFIANVPIAPEFEFPQATAEANARLIAAAPDLLALAKQYASECLDCNYGDGATGKTPEGEPCEWCGSTRAVIAKATGEHS